MIKEYLKKAWTRFRTPITIAEWHWSGNDLSDLPRAAWRDFMRTIRAPLLRMLSSGDLIVIGDIYANANSHSPLIQVPADRHCVVIGAIAVYDGPPGIVPCGCNPPV